MTNIIVLLALLAMNHILELYIQHDAVAIDACIAIGYLMYLFL